MINISCPESAKRVFHFFEEISKIPHGSGNTKSIADYLVSFANERGLDVIRDGANNVIIKKPATKGRENRPGIIFQGHTDMVLAQEQNVNIDLQNEGLDLYIDGDFLKARGTTLGADDGIAVAYALALLDSSEIEHPSFEAVFTSDEEIGLLGAVALDADNIDGRLLINIDSDAEGIFTVGCAGGLRCDVCASYTEENAGEYVYSLSLSSLRGGHSGVEIAKGRQNAIKALADILSSIDGIRLVSLDCGNADNAIPRDASATFISDVDISDALKELCDKKQKELISLGECDAEVLFAAIKESSRTALSSDDTKNIISLIKCIPSGVLAMSSDIEGLVETSENLGIARLFGGELTLTVSVRSAKGKEKRAAADNIASIAKNHGATVNEHGEYPSWEYKKDSYLRDLMCDIYEKMYKKPAEVLIIHAGLECGIFAGKIEGLDCVSIGPDNFDIHTPEERLSISSSVRVWEYLLEVLKNI